MSRRFFLAIAIAAVAIRAWQIDAPFIDHWSWRQADVAAIARNYNENGFHFAKPQIDWAGNEPGYVGTEFPVLPFLAAMLYRLTGTQEWIGRFQSIFFFALSVPFFFLLARRVNRDAPQTDFEIFALLFYCFTPLSVGTGRAFMPDMPSLSCALAGLYFFWRWLDAGGGRACYGASAIALALAILLKLPMIVIGVPMLALSWQKFRLGLFRQPLLWLLAGTVLLPAFFWYWHARDIARDFYPYHFFGAGGVHLMPWNWYGKILNVFVFESFTPLLLLLALAGVGVSWRRPALTPLRWWLAAMVAFFFVVGYGNRHPWYQLPLVPVLSIFAAFFAARSRASGVLATVLFLAGVAWPIRAYFRPSAEPAYLLGRALGEITPPTALIMIADDGDPTALYYAQRKGWHLLEKNGVFDGNPGDAAQIIANLERLRGKGGTYFACLRGTKWWLDLYPDFTAYLAQRCRLLRATDDFRIYHFE